MNSSVAPSARCRLQLLRKCTAPVSHFPFGTTTRPPPDFSHSAIAAAKAPVAFTPSFAPKSAIEKSLSANLATGIGGISTGAPVVFRVAFKPTPSISKEQDSVDLASGKATKLVVKGRHDPCVVLRAVPCVEAAAAIAVYDAVLERKREL